MSKREREGDKIKENKMTDTISFFMQKAFNKLSGSYTEIPFLLRDVMVD